MGHYFELRARRSNATTAADFATFDAIIARERTVGAAVVGDSCIAAKDGNRPSAAGQFRDPLQPVT